MVSSEQTKNSQIDAYSNAIKGINISNLMEFNTLLSNRDLNGIHAKFGNNLNTLKKVYIGYNLTQLKSPLKKIVVKTIPKKKSTSKTHVIPKKSTKKTTSKKTTKKSTKKVIPPILPKPIVPKPITSPFSSKPIFREENGRFQAKSKRFPKTIRTSINLGGIIFSSVSITIKKKVSTHIVYETESTADLLDDYILLLKDYYNIRYYIGLELESTKYACYMSVETLSGIHFTSLSTTDFSSVKDFINEWDRLVILLFDSIKNVYGESFLGYQMSIRAF